MRIPDVNVLLKAVNEGDQQHVGARRWMEAAMSGGETIGFAWHTLLGFVRLVTNPSAMPRPLDMGLAFDQVQDWLSVPVSSIVNPGPRHLAILRELATDAGAGSRLVANAHLAALAIEADATVVSYDRDFRIFRGVRVEELA